MEKKIVEGQKGDDITPFDGMPPVKSNLKIPSKITCKVKCRIGLSDGSAGAKYICVQLWNLF
jgi:hypothetical protein